MDTQHIPDVPIDPEEGEPTKARRRPGGRSARVQAAAFEATLELLQEKGYEAPSLALIAERAGVHETSLYRRWKTKERLIISAISSRVAREIPLPDTGALRSDLIELLRYLQTFLQSSLGQVLVQMAIISRHIPEIGTLHKDYWENRRALLRPLFESAIARGEISPQTDVQLLFESLIGVFYVRMFLLNEVVDESLAERLVDQVLSGVR